MLWPGGQPTVGCNHSHSLVVHRLRVMWFRHAYGTEKIIGGSKLDLLDPHEDEIPLRSN